MDNLQYLQGARMHGDLVEQAMPAFISWLQKSEDVQQQLELAVQQQESSGAVVALQMDVLEAANHDPAVGQALLVNPDALRLMLMEELHSHGVLTQRWPRLWLRLKGVPVDYPTLQELAVKAVSYGTHICCCTGVVHSMSTLTQRIYSRTLRCRHCGSVQEALEGEAVPRCCEMQAVQPDLEEDLSQRVLVPVQELWLADPCTSNPGVLGTYGAHKQSIKVTLVDDLAGHSLVKMGQCVSVVGQARVVAGAGRMVSGGQVAATVEMDALNLLPAMLHAPWLSSKMLGSHAAARPGSCGPSGQSTLVSGTRAPLQALCDAAMDALDVYIQPHLCLALMLSAASSSSTPAEASSSVATSSSAAFSDSTDRPVPSSSQVSFGFPGVSRSLANIVPGSSARDSAAGALSGSSQGNSHISIVVCQEAFDPQATRMLRAAASLMCPNSLALGPHMEDALVPKAVAQQRATDQSGEASMVLCSSMLTACNMGVVVVDGAMLGSKDKAQLKQMLTAGCVKVGPRQEHLVPVTASVWAITHGAASCAAYKGCSLLYADDSAPVMGRGGGKQGTKMAADGFDLVLSAQIDEDIAMACVLEAGVDLEDGGQQAKQGMEQKVAALRHHMALTGSMPPGIALTEQAQDFLMRYFVSVRQSCPTTIAPRDVLPPLIKLATACARLLLRNQVQVVPDCMVAVVLMEQTLHSRMSMQGESYQNMDLEGLGGRADTSIDQQLEVMHGQVIRHLKGFAMLGQNEE